MVSVEPGAPLGPEVEAGEDAAAGDTVAETVDALEASVAAGIRAMLQSVDAGVLDPLREAARGAAAALETVLLTTDGADDRALRDGAVDLVFLPLAMHLATLDIGRALGALATRAVEARRAVAAESPERVARAEPAGLYGPDPDDPAVRRLRKSMVRAGRRTRLAQRAAANAARGMTRRPRLDPPAFTQDVPLRVLVSYHCERRMPAIDARVLEAAAQHSAGPLAETTVAATLLARVLRGRATLTGSSAPPADAGDADLREPAERLLSSLRRLASLPPATDAVDVEGGDWRRAWGALRADTERAGSFMLPEGTRSLPAEPDADARRAARRAEQWSDWHRAVAGRFTLLGRALAFRRALEHAHAGLVEEVDGLGARPVADRLEDAAAALAAMRGELDNALDAPATDPSALEDTLRGLLERALHQIGAGVLDPIEAEKPEATIRRAAEARVEALAGMLAELPESVAVHPIESLEADRQRPEADAHAVRVRELAEQSFDALRLERIRTAPQPVIAAVDRVRGEAERLRAVVRFSLESAIEELRDGGLEGVRELGSNGLARSEESLRDVRSRLEEEVGTFAGRAAEAVDEAWHVFDGRIRVEDRIQEQLLDMRYRARSAFRDALGRARVGTRHALQLSRRGFRIGRRRTLELVRLSQTAVEGERMTADEQQRTLDALADVERLVADLPLVYRRLFAFAPVTDPTLLEGRGADIALVERQLGHWREGQTDALLLSGYDGSGRRSLLNVLRTTVLADADVREWALERRIQDESALVAEVAALLDVDAPADGTLDALAAALTAAGRDPGPPRVRIVEHLEHLYLRTSGGNGLIGRFLSFMSHTDSIVFWIGTMSEHSWQVLQRTDPTTARLLRHHTLPPVDRATLEAIVMNRHARSGLPVVFEMPADASQLLRRRLARMPAEAERQTMLRADFFDRLARASGHNIMLALFYWLRSAHPDEAGRLRVGPLEPLSFGYLDGFVLAQAFTLKAFLDHATLTLAEHDAIFECARDESRRLFESLGNLLLIEPAGEAAKLRNFTFTTIADDRPYRIRPLLVQPVSVYLRSRNIIH